MEKDNELDIALENMMLDYLAICNRAIQKNADKFLYQQAKKLNRMLCDESYVHTIVYDQNPNIVIGEFMIHFDPKDQKLSLAPLESQDVAFSWKVPHDYLQDVVETRPDWYIKHPVMLDWKWFRERTLTESRNLIQTPHLLKTGIAGFILGSVAGALFVHLASRNSDE